jgi:regulator of replication initiation timing
MSSLELVILENRLEKVSKRVSELLTEARVIQLEVAEVRRALETRQYVESK